LKDLIKPEFHQLNFPAEKYIKNELRVRLDKDDQICRLSLTPSGCPLGPLHCPLRHTIPSPLNFQSTKSNPIYSANRLPTVCKHWLRGLCKKGDSCEFLHEYNLRRMPECWWFAKYGFCSAGDECLYAHPKERRVECPDYKRGFCALGPQCPRKHVKRVACQLYLTGFCPNGPDCTRGHPKPEVPAPEDYAPPPPPQSRELGPPPPGFARYAELERPGAALAVGQGTNTAANAMQRRNLDEVTCFKCGEQGHYANHCPNKNVPGNRGGLDRTSAWKFGTPDAT